MARISVVRQQPEQEGVHILLPPLEQGLKEEHAVLLILALSSEILPPGKILTPAEALLPAEGLAVRTMGLPQLIAVLRIMEVQRVREQVPLQEPAEQQKWKSAY